MTSYERVWYNSTMIFKKRKQKAEVVDRVTATPDYITASTQFEKIETLKALTDYLTIYGISPLILQEMTEQMEEVCNKGKNGTFLDGFLKWEGETLTFQKHEDNMDRGDTLRLVTRWNEITTIIYDLINNHELVLELETQHKSAYMFKLDNVIVFRGQ